MNVEDIPIIATTIAVISRFIFMWLLYVNKSTNTYSLTFCILSIISSSMWLNYSITINNISLVYRSSTEIGLLGISMMYIIRNKIKSKNQVLPLNSQIQHIFNFIFFLEDIIKMAQHFRNQHIRAQQPQQHVRKQQSAMEKFQHMFSSQMQRIRSSPRMMIGWILFFFFLAVAIAAGGHYMRYWTIPKVSFIPQKPAPASHLQYFFF